MQRMMLPPTCQHLFAACNERIADAYSQGGCATGGEQDLLALAHAKELRDRLMGVFTRPQCLDALD